MSVKLPKELIHLQEALAKLPGVGNKTAFRYAMGLLKWSAEARENIVSAIQKLDHIRECANCRFITETEICHICQDASRESYRKICVVQNINDVMAIESTSVFKGHYFVLGGVLNPLLGIGPEELKIDSLVRMILKFDTKEILLAISPSIEGDATCSYIREILPEQVQCMRIGFGLPVGGNLEYLDGLTISKALENSKTL
jgi:recombination protein RecR